MSSGPQFIHALNPRLKRFLYWTIVLLSAGYTFLDYWAYSKVQHEDPLGWAQLVAGKGPVPAQYRIGVYYTAGFFARLSHLQLRHVFATADFFCVGLSLICLFFLLTRLPSFRAATVSVQWVQAFLALLLIQIYLGWTFWFQEPETMPSLAILAVCALLCWEFMRDDRTIPLPMLSLSLLLVAVLGATIRVDAVIAFAAGMLVASIGAKVHSQARAWLTGTSLLALLAALLIERWIAHTLFPHAIRSAPLFQLAGNLHSLNGALALLLTLPAWILTLWLAARRWSALSLWQRGLVVGSVLHFIMFLTFGMSEEVRIFIPFLLVLVPLSTTLLYAWFAGEPLNDLVL